ncbi:Uncharacterised protein [Streptococcus pneumoniae]|nr:Uncharacterised protein [Streptococcus pneumoniae]
MKMQRNITTLFQGKSKIQIIQMCYVIFTVVDFLRL